MVCFHSYFLYFSLLHCSFPSCNKKCYDYCMCHSYRNSIFSHCYLQTHFLIFQTCRSCSQPLYRVPLHSYQLTPLSSLSITTVLVLYLPRDTALQNPTFVLICPLIPIV